MGSLLYRNSPLISLRLLTSLTIIRAGLAQHFRSHPEAGKAVTEHGLSAKLSPMNAHVDHILDEALGLPPDERSALTVALLDSLEGSDDSSITEAWRQEIGARQAALRAGTVKAVSWAEAKARLSAL